MKTIILAGGYGSRLSEETLLKPKPLVEVGPYPILWHIMKIYSMYDIKDYIIALGYKGNMIREYFMNYHNLNTNTSVNLDSGKITRYDKHAENWNVHLLDTGKDTQTGGRIKRAMEFAGRERIMATYGDGLANVKIDKLINFHKSHGKLATLTAVRPPSRFGEINFDGDKVSNFQEKPQVNQGWINGGYFVLEPEVVDYIDSDSTPFERSPLEILSKEGQLMAYKHEDYWQPMDVVREKHLLDDLWYSGSAPWKIW